MRTERVEIQLSPDEKRRLVEAARSAHLPLATWIRWVALKHLDDQLSEGSP